jgi:hypothetical protein
MIYEKDKYNNGARSLLKFDKVFLIEGELSKPFYQNLPEICKYTIKNGGSCNSIKEEVKKYDNYYGIIDNDYNDFSVITHERIFRIDYYSIENIVLNEHPEYHSLKEKILNLVVSSNFGEIVIRKLKLRIIRNQNNKAEEVEILFTDCFHYQYHKFLKEQINKNNYLKYIDLKECVITYMIFIHEVKGNFKFKHLLELNKMIKTNSLSYILNINEYKRFIGCINKKC